MSDRRSRNQQTPDQSQYPVPEPEARLAALDEAIARGLADVEAGRVSPADEVFARLKAKYRAAANRPD